MNYYGAAVALGVFSSMIACASPSTDDAATDDSNEVRADKASTFTCKGVLFKVTVDTKTKSVTLAGGRAVMYSPKDKKDFDLTELTRSPKITTHGDTTTVRGETISLDIDRASVSEGAGSGLFYTTEMRNELETVTCTDGSEDPEQYCPGAGGEGLSACGSSSRDDLSRIPTPLGGGGE